MPKAKETFKAWLQSYNEKRFQKHKGLSLRRWLKQKPLINDVF